MNTVPRSLRLGFAGTPHFAVPALDALRRSRHRVVTVFTQPDRPAGRGLGLQVSPVKQRAAELGISVLQPESFKTAAAQAALYELNLDALIVVAYGLILPAGALAAPALGCFNIHASLLPRWRGAAPIQRALLAGDERTGVTIMRMEEGLDTGPMLAVRETPIGPGETAETLHDRLAVLGAELLIETLDAVAAGRAHARPQPPEGITYAQKISKAEAVIDWRQDAGSVLRRVRAFNPWPIAQTLWEGAQLRVWEAELGSPLPAAPEVPVARAEAAGVRQNSGTWKSETAPPGTVIAASSDGIDVACGQGSLRILKLQLAGRKALPAQEFIKSQRLAGARFACA